MTRKDDKIIIYQTEDGETKLEVKLVNDTVWLNQNQMAELFGKNRKTINRHIVNLFKERELIENSVCSDYEHTAFDNKVYNVKFYNLDVIISVGYRVKSLRGTQFRIWATQKLKELLVRGFVLDDEKLKKNIIQKTYFDELEERIRNIRVSEANFYQKVRDVFATSVDYDTKNAYARKFFSVIQNKFHFAITGLTASEIVNSRISRKKNNLGLTNWGGKIITRNDAQVAKNYLEELELKRLNLLVEQFLSFAELQSVEKRPMYMQNWLLKLDDFLILNDKKILNNSGKISHQQMEKKVRKELAEFNRNLLTNSLLKASKCDKI